MATRGGSPSECLSQKFNIRITRRDLCTLKGLQWLNDEVRREREGGGGGGEFL